MNSLLFLQYGLDDNAFEFRILWVDEIDPSQFSIVFKMELFIRPLLLLLQLGVLSH